MTQAQLLAVDQGTSGTKALIVTPSGQVVARGEAPLVSQFPAPGWVEQDPEAIYQSALAAVRACLRQWRAGGTAGPGALAACGLSNQRETFLLWDETGRPLCPAVVWQCKRSVGLCERLQGTGLAAEIRRRTGLRLDPYFSGTKLLWLHENQEALRRALDSGSARFGTIDTWLLYRLTDGRAYRTDYTNAARTLFFNLAELQWDRTLLQAFGLAGLRLPAVGPSAASYGVTDFAGLLEAPLPIRALVGDSHAAAFGEGCVTRGSAKATLGTGCSLLLNTGPQPVPSRHGLVTTLCWSAADRVDYALEGIIVTCGATLTWLRDQLDLFADSAETEALATGLADNAGVYLVPAFSGLGAPHWRMDLKAAVLGLTLGCDRRHLVRAALESIAYQVRDVIEAMATDSGIALQSLQVDGGISRSGFVMQFLTDLLGVTVSAAEQPDASALGAALLAGLPQGRYADTGAWRAAATRARVYRPGPLAEVARRGYAGWQQAVGTLTNAPVTRATPPRREDPR